MWLGGKAARGWEAEWEGRNKQLRDPPQILVPSQKKNQTGCANSLEPKEFYQMCGKDSDLKSGKLYRPEGQSPSTRMSLNNMKSAGDMAQLVVFPQHP